MNKLFLSIAILFLVFSVRAQEYPLTTGAKIVSSVNEIQITENQPVEVDVRILRSKNERRTKFAIPTIQRVDGLKYDLVATETADTFKLLLNPEDMMDGSYTVIIKGSGPFKRYLTSAMVSLKVSKAVPMIVNNQ